jgi:hypothetical protein
MLGRLKLPSDERGKFCSVDGNVVRCARASLATKRKQHETFHEDFMLHRQGRHVLLMLDKEGMPQRNEMERVTTL